LLQKLTILLNKSHYSLLCFN